MFIIFFLTDVKQAKSLINTSLSLTWQHCSCCKVMFANHTFSITGNNDDRNIEIAQNMDYKII